MTLIQRFQVLYLFKFYGKDLTYGYLLDVAEQVLKQNQEEVVRFAQVAL